LACANAVALAGASAVALAAVAPQGERRGLCHEAAHAVLAVVMVLVVLQVLLVLQVPHSVSHFMKHTEKVF